MTSDKQLKANCRNSLKSTGPKTAPGKYRSSKNSIKHGLLSQEIILPGEDPRFLSSLRNAINNDLQPEGAIEELLADRIIFGFWRLQRMGYIAADHYLIDGCSCLVGYQCMSLFGRYEATAERSLYRALTELQRLQARRKDTGDNASET